MQALPLTFSLPIGAAKATDPERRRGKIMFDIGASELLVLVIVAVLVIGPKDMPLALRTAGRWIGKIRRVSSHFRTGLDAMVREAELEEMEKKWKAQNDAIMARSNTGAGSDSSNDEEMTGPAVKDSGDPYGSGDAAAPETGPESAAESKSNEAAAEPDPSRKDAG